MSLIVSEYRCPEHDKFELLVERSQCPDVVPCPVCEALSPWTISAPGVKTVYASAAVHGSAERAPHPLALDTRELGEGMPISEWRKKRAAKWRQKDVNDPKRREFGTVVDKVAHKAEGVVRDRPDQKRSKLAKMMSWMRGGE